MNTGLKQVRNLEARRDNRLVNTSYHLSLNERRLIELAIALIGKDNKVPDVIEVTAQQYGELFNISDKNVYRELSSATANLYQQSISIIDASMETKEETRWVDRVKYREREGTIEISFSKWVKPYLQDLSSQFTHYGLLDIGKMTSAHTIRIYELLMQFRSTGLLRISVDDLRMKMKLEDSYPRFSELERRVITPAITSINNVTTWEVKLEKIKRGAKITNLEFRFRAKDQLSFDL